MLVSDVGAAAGAERQVHVGGFAGGRGLRLVEIRVTVEEQQPVALAAAPQRQQVAEQDRAVAAQHHREPIRAPPPDRRCRPA